MYLVNLVKNLKCDELPIKYCFSTNLTNNRETD